MSSETSRRGRWRALALTIALAALWVGAGPGAEEAPSVGEAVLLEVDGAIGPATRDYLTRSLATAAERGAEVVIIRLDTPGGLDASTRDIVKAILASPVPVVTYVAPGGARAASAGTYILYASHVAAMAPATNLGAATPVAIGGAPAAPGEPPDATSEDDEEPGPAGQAEAMTRKVVNDAAAYIRGLAEQSGRNADWAEQAVREGVSIPFEEALEQGVVEIIAQDIPDLLRQIDGWTVQVQGQERTLRTAGLVVTPLDPDWRSELLGVITNPTVAYILLLIGVYGLIFEGYNPGAIVPGVVGAICLLLALYALQLLPVNYAGLALIGLGIILMIAEAVAPSFGALGIGGVIAMVIGSIILIDTDVPGLAVSRPLIGAIGFASALLLMAIIGFAVRARQRPVVAGREQMVGALGTALEGFDGRGEVYVHSERWSAETEAPVRQGQAIEVTGIEGLVLRVRPVPEAHEDAH